MKKFAALEKQAQTRKGGVDALHALLPKVASVRQLCGTADDRYLAAMTRCINQAGFNWSVIDKKWPQFEEAFFGFDSDKLGMLSAAQWEAYTGDTRVVRNWQKIAALRDNVAFVREVSGQHKGFGRFLANWPASDQVGLMQFLNKNGSRLGGSTSQWFLRAVGKDSFILSNDVVTALQNAGVEIRDKPTSQADLKRVQQAFNAWHEESGLPYTHLSKIASYSIGINHDSEYIAEQTRKFARTRVRSG